MSAFIVLVFNVASVGQIISVPTNVNCRFLLEYLNRTTCETDTTNVNKSNTMLTFILNVFFKKSLIIEQVYFDSSHVTNIVDLQ